MISSDKPVLSIETATPVCSVALRLPDGSIHEERTEGRGVHSEMTFVFIDRLLRNAGLGVSGLGAVLISSGPGSYTGLRVGSSAVKGLLFQTDIPLYACNTLGGIAVGALRKSGYRTWDTTSEQSIHTVIDARRNHLYHQAWQIGESGAIPISKVSIRELDDVLAHWTTGEMVAGTGTGRLYQLAVSRGVDIAGYIPFPGPEIISAENFFAFADDSVMHKVTPGIFEPEYYAGM